MLRIQDVFEPHERGTIMGIYYAAPLLGPSLGPSTFICNSFYSGVDCRHVPMQSLEDYLHLASPGVRHFGFS